MSASTVMNKLTAERNQRLLMELVSKPGNDICADCKARNPRWASFNLGIFICVSCASIHRKIGTHISKVKSITLDSWTKEQVDRMKEMGNVKSNAIYNSNEVRNPPPPRLDDPARDNDLEQYIRSKYEYKRFIDKNALVASKLGPSRSASSVTPRTKPSPANAPEKPGSAPPEPKTATDIAASMFSTTKPQLQPRTTMVSQPAPSAPRSLPTRSASQPFISRNPVPPAATKPEGVWTDLISLQGPSTNASLPLQYQAPSTNLGGISSSSTMPTGFPGMSTNPFSNMTGLSTTGSFPQQPFFTNGLAQQQPLALQGSLSPFTPPASGPSFQPISPLIPSNFSPSSNSPLFQIQAPLQTSPTVPFYQPQPQLTSLGTPQPQPHFLSSSPNPQFLPSSSNPQFTSPSPQLLSTTPTVQQQNSALNTTTESGVGLGGGVPGYLTPSPQPIVNRAHGQGLQVSTMGVQPNPVFSGGLVTQPPPMSSNNNPFGQMQFGQAGFSARNAGQWGPL